MELDIFYDYVNKRSYVKQINKVIKQSVVWLKKIRNLKGPRNVDLYFERLVSSKLVVI